MEGRELRRSYTEMEFPVRHRQSQHGKNPASKRISINSKRAPAIELYKPPNQRSSAQSGISSSTKLNVHAKEFSPLQSSKSTGTVNHLEGKHKHMSVEKVQFTTSRNHKGSDLHEMTAKNLQKSKSTSNAHQAMGAIPAQVELFEDKNEKMLIMKALADFKTIGCLEQIDTLPKMIIGKALRVRSHAQSWASLCISLIERDPSGAFLEGLLNCCRYTLQTKCMVDCTPRYHAFMAFLNELYSLIKPKVINEKEGLSLESPSHIVLHMIVQVCQNILQQKKMQSAEIECLFFTVTTIGRDLEMEDSKLLDGLMNSVRDAFLSQSTTESIRKTLLQLIELRASKWSLPLGAFVFYSNNLS
ncbi:MIF4G domain-containing protein A [Cimex lectularius]|uniref:MIF4G domain-containing protein n=1 Tax=Cimex lectularius TaxID=79782 RepID=A0A8I6RFS3_CIMLE|nr:MIF4G domain-containing protein A [Cimex lectularius]XP_014244321.1 MIF4G domain-containing protein A [Cimex lectularius]